jgi:hypothetical protein
MQDRRLAPDEWLCPDGHTFAWPEHPDIFVTLLATVATASLFLGVGTLTQQHWLTWVGLVVAAAVLFSHLFRHRCAQSRRQATAHVMQASLISRCRVRGGSNFMNAYTDSGEPVVLALTDNALHLCQPDPVRVFLTIPLYNIEDLSVVEFSHWDALHLLARLGEQREHHLIVYDFESHAPVQAWVAAFPSPSARRSSRRSREAGSHPLATLGSSHSA